VEAAIGCSGSDDNFQWKRRSIAVETAQFPVEATIDCGGSGGSFQWKRRSIAVEAAAVSSGTDDRLQ
jgi:hypothetical protein